jgi:hypothetical protein
MYADRHRLESVLKLVRLVIQLDQLCDYHRWSALFISFQTFLVNLLSPIRRAIRAGIY